MNEDQKANPIHPQVQSSGPAVASPSRAIRIWKRIKTPLSIAVSLGIAVLAIFAIRKIARDVRPEEVLATITATSNWHLALAVIFTALSFVALTGQEYFAIRSIGKNLLYRVAALGSFLAQSIAHATGFNVLVGGGVRARYYETKGLGVQDAIIVQLSFSGTFTLATGILLGVALWREPGHLAEAMHIPEEIHSFVGLLGVVVCLGLMIAAWRHRLTSIFGYRLNLPSGPSIAYQVFLSMADIIALVAVLYVLLPAEVDVSYVALLGIVPLAFTIGVASHVPGGLGVFETVVLVLIGPEGHQLEATVAALLLFRAIYYLLPLAVGTAVFVGIEFHRGHWHLRKTRK